MVRITKNCDYSSILHQILGITITRITLCNQSQYTFVCFILQFGHDGNFFDLHNKPDV